MAGLFSRLFGGKKPKAPKPGPSSLAPPKEGYSPLASPLPLASPVLTIQGIAAELEDLKVGREQLGHRGAHYTDIPKREEAARVWMAWYARARQLGAPEQPPETDRAAVRKWEIEAAKLAGPMPPRPWTRAEMRRWRDIGSEEMNNFVYRQQWLPVNSSNVVQVQYIWEVQKMIVEYMNGGRYLYSNVTDQEAIDFVRAPSKGGWVWSVLRVRGTKKGHKKPYVKVR